MVSLRDLLRERAGLDVTLGEMEKINSSNSRKVTTTDQGEKEGEKMDQPLQSAPSLLAVLMKLMGMTAGIASAAPVFLSTGGSESGSLAASSKKSKSAASAGKGKKTVGGIGISGGGGGGSSSGGGGSSKGVPVRLTPPLLSTAMRTTWVDCVVLCYRLGDGLTGPARVDPLSFLQRMMDVVALNPRSQRAAGGTRLSALQIISALFADDVLATKLAPWAYDVLHLCHKALKSSGNNEPYYRLLAVRAATSVAVGCRTAALLAEEAAAIRDGGPTGKVGTFAIQGAWEDNVIAEAVRLMNRAVDDRFSEVRGEAATFAAAAAPLMIKSDRSGGSGGGRGGGGGGGGSGSSGASGPMSPTPSGSADHATGPLSSLDDVMHIALKNIDDESAAVALGWAEALARCICTSIEADETAKAESDSTGNRHSADDGDGAGPGSGHGSASSGASAGDFAAKFKAFSEGKGGGRTTAYTASCTSVVSSIDFLVGRFIKVGGEYSASKCGGAFSSGGRAVRVGIASAIMELLKLQVATNDVGMSGSAATDVLTAVLGMVGPAMEQQLRQPSSGGGHARIGSCGNQRFPDTLEVTSSPVARSSDRPSSSAGGAALLFSQKKMRSTADSGLVRTEASRVLRRGLAEVSSEGGQQALLRDLASLCRPSLGLEENGGSIVLNRYQLQIVLIELSHLITALGEAGTSGIEDALPVLKVALSHHDHGVRYEASIALQAAARAFPQEGRKTVLSSLDSLMDSWDNLVALADTQESPGEERKEESPTRRRRFRRNKGNASPTTQPSAQMETSLKHQYSVHGHGLAISLLLHELPMSSGGIDMEMLDKIITVAYSLVKCQNNELLAKATPGAVCTCVRSGYGLICAALSTGPQAVSSHIAGFFRLWQNSVKHAEEGMRYFSPSHDLSCLDAMLVSLVSFLKSCSELLLSVPDALNRTTLLLEKVFPLVSPGGRLGTPSENPAAASRLDSAKASVMEAFSWLPPGSYAFAADQVFSFAALHIQELTEEEVCCSILGSLVSSEDKILDAHSFARATSVGQTGGATRLEDTLVSLLSDPAHHSERESVLHALAWKKKNRKESFAMDIFESHILELSDTEEDRTAAPTPLHAVGTWKQPSSPSQASQVRLLDAAIHCFSSTFGMQDGRAQDRASRALGSLLPATLLQSARSLTVTASSLITENEKQKPRSRDEIAAASNISATLLACLQALPLHEASTENFISMGPPWMNRAKDLFFALLPSSVHLVRRAAAEGLSMLATLGVTEDAHTLQSTILHSLDELMKGHLPDGTARKFQLNDEALSSVKAGSLLTLACIQRTAQKMDSDERDRARARSDTQTSEESTDTAPQTMIMITRVLPSCATHSLESDFFYVRAHALHALAVLIAYSLPESQESFSEENLHIVQKAVESVESNFLSAWTAITADFDGGHEGEKFAAEPAFLAVLLRFMTLLLPRLHLIESTDPCIASRFSSMASSIMENSVMHPTVFVEGFSFFERLTVYTNLLSKGRLSVSNTADPAASCMPFIVKAYGTIHPQPLHEHGRLKSYGFTSLMCQRAAVNLLRLLSQRKCGLSVSFIEKAQIHGHLLRLLDTRCGSRHFQHASFYRTISAPRDAERSVGEGDALETEIILALQAIYAFESSTAQDAGASSMHLLHLILMSRVLIAGITRSENDMSSEEESLNPSVIIRRAEDVATLEASLVLSHSSTCRWQVRCHSAKTASSAIHDIARTCRRSFDEKQWKQCPDFHPSAALALLSKECQHAAAAGEKKDDELTTYAALHLQSLVIAACSTAVATSDQAELPSLQRAGLRLLAVLVEHFGDALDPESSSVMDGQSQTVLQHYSSQIASGVRHALTISSSSGGDDISYEGLPQLYAAGCEALQVVARKSIISDVNVLKRFVRNVLPSVSEIHYVTYADARTKESRLRGNLSTSLTDDRSVPLLFLVWKLRALAELRLNAMVELIPQPFAASLEQEARSGGVGAGIYAAALALDGARVLRDTCSKKALCAKAGLEQSSRMSSSQPAGLTFSTFHDVDESVFSSMSLSWPFLANYAVSVLANVDDSAEVEHDDINEWLDVLIPLLFAGLYDALNNISYEPPTSGALPAPADVAIAGLEALCTLLEKGNNTLMTLAGDLQSILDLLKDKLILPLLKLPSSWDDSDESTAEEVKGGETQSIISHTSNRLTLIAQACRLLETTCRARTASASNGTDSSIGGTALLQAFLLPLTALESGAVSLSGDDYGAMDIIFSSCFRCSDILISEPHDDIGDGVDQRSLARAVMMVAVSVLTPPEGSNTSLSKTNDAATGLLMTCVTSALIDTPEKRQLSVTTAEAGCWDAWKAVCSELDDGFGLSYSMPSIIGILADWDNSDRQISALAALRNAVQVSDQQDGGSTIGIIMQAAGAEIVSILKAYGVCSTPQGGVSDRLRVEACADSMKLIMVALQQLCSPGEAEEANVSAFLTVVFDIFTSLISYNGLPNRPSGRPNADPSLGRMCAQGLVHVVRTSPAAFKDTMALLEAEDRAVLEMAVRADMTGYAVAQSQAPAKKKLSLKGFK